MVLNLEAALQTAKAAAIAAERAAARNFSPNRGGRRIREDRPEHTLADREANIAVLSVISNSLGKHGIDHLVSEEEIKGPTRRRLKPGESRQYCWYIDPMDCSTTVDPLGWSVSVGVVNNQGVSVIGAVCLPLRGNGYELFFAAKGQGAYVEFPGGSPSRIQVSACSDPAQAKVARSGNRDPISSSVYDRVGVPDDTEHRLKIPGGVRKGVEIARGSLDGWLAGAPYYSHDFCAVTVLIQEAGGRVLYTSGKVKGQVPSFPNPHEARHEGIWLSNGCLSALDKEIERNPQLQSLRGRYKESKV